MGTVPYRDSPHFFVLRLHRLLVCKNPVLCLGKSLIKAFVYINRSFIYIIKAFVYRLSCFYTVRRHDLMKEWDAANYFWHIFFPLIVWYKYGLSDFCCPDLRFFLRNVTAFSDNFEKLRSL